MLQELLTIIFKYNDQKTKWNILYHKDALRIHFLHLNKLLLLLIISKINLKFLAFF